MAREARRGSVTLSESIDEEIRDTLSSSPTENRAPQTVESPTYARSSYVGNPNIRGLDSPTRRHGSIAGIGVGVTSPNQARKKRLDPSDPSTWTSPVSASSTDGRPRASSESYGGMNVPTFQFDGPSEAKKEQTTVAQANVPTHNRSGSLVAALSNELYNVQVEDTPSQTTGRPTELTESAMNTQAPQITKHLSPSPTGLGSDKGNDNDNDHDRRFSNHSASFSTMTDDSDRIGVISHDSNDKDDEDAVQESSEDERSSSEQDEGSPVVERGRIRKSQHGKSPSSEDEREVSEPETPATPVTPVTPVSPSIKVDEVDATTKDHPSVPSHSGALSETKGHGIVPRSNYRGASPAALSAIGDDDAELRRAKALELRTSPVDEKIKDRTVKMIIRGDWGAFQDADDTEVERASGHIAGYRHEPRLYLVCSDLSNEATYALEWTVGTLLKDGDTLLIVSANEDENAAKHNPKDHDEPSLEVRLESAKAAEEANSTMFTLTRQTTNQEGRTEAKSKSSLAVAGAMKDQATRSLSRTGRMPTKREEERLKAVEKLEQDFLRFVRKTTLQVRCMIEVIHCRSPRHLILNAIDELEPTLVVVGTRGQSTVKGVVMGSFSNYLVTKSSVPVMVARKRLKKAHHAKVSSQQIRMTNNLMPFGGAGKRKLLTQARID